jgi:membrane protease YdiL (CAAX protease family)
MSGRTPDTTLPESLANEPLGNAGFDPPATPARRGYLAVECAALFLGIPLAYALGVRPPLLAMAVAIAAVVFLWLWFDPTFDRRTLWNPAPLRRHLPSVFALFALAAIALSAAVWVFLPTQWFILPRQRPALWAMIMVFYPLVSVYPQELIYRVFFFHRYRPLFGDGAAVVLASAVTFGYMHMIFPGDPVISVALTLVGGLLFAWRYHHTRSLLLVCIEHAIYGQLIFTVGLGRYFYHGAQKTVELLNQ